MPYRRLPNTDSARLRALKYALKKGEDVVPQELPFSQGILQKIRYFLPEFEQAVIVKKQSSSTHAERNKEYYKLLKKAKLYISHFVQVLNFSILRGELPESARSYYGLDEKSRNVPFLNTEKDLIVWGEKVIKGETQRIANGGSFISNPTIAVVKVRYEKFMEIYHAQQSLKTTSHKALDKVSGLRERADTIIQDLWNEIEHFYCILPDELRRQKAREFGVMYVIRKIEIEKRKERELEERLQYSFLFHENPVN